VLGGARGRHAWRDGPIPEPDILELPKLQAFSGVAAFSGGERTLTGEGDPARVASGIVTASLFRVLDVAPSLGRTFEADERGVAVLSEALWRGRFQADPRVLGRSVSIDGEPHQIVGVMPERFNFPPRAQLWTPLQLRPTYRGNVIYKVLARLAPGVGREQAQAQVVALFENIGRTLAPEKRMRELLVVGLRESMVGDVRRLLFVLWGAVLFVLLIGCANMANLLMSRAAVRGQEMYVRRSLGAGRARLVRQLLTESAALALLGGALGLALANVGLPAFLAAIPPRMLPRIEEVRIGAGVLGFTLAMSFFTSLLFGVVPALLCSRNDTTLPQRAGSSPPRREKRLHSTLIVAETALVLVLLIGAGLLAKSFYRLQSVEPGFRRDGLVTLTVWLPDRTYRTAADKRALHTRLLERLAAVPEIEAPSAINLLPFGEAGWQGDFEVEGRQTTDLVVGKPAVSPGYFRTLGIPLLRGRFFDEGDVEGAPRVAIVSEAVAAHCWPGENALGKRLRMDSSRPDRWLSVVGIVGDVRQATLANAPQPMIYVPLGQEWRDFFLGPMAFVARAKATPQALPAALRAQLRAVDPELPAQRIEMLEALLSDSLAPPRFRTALLLAFGLLALSLALVGVYGVMAYEVARRTGEIGIRRALGAQTGHVLRLVLGRTVRLVSSGLFLGVLGALLLTRVLEGFLFAVRPLDAPTFALVSLALAAAALLASALPARRAALVDPAVALRDE
jgi:putative ABC transport system permease protein